MDAIAKRIKEQRIHHKETQDEIAKILNVGRTTICEYERGTIKPPVKKLKILSNHWNVSVEYLIGEPDLQLFAESVPDDIIFVLSNLIQRLKDPKSGLLYRGKQIDDRTRTIILSSIETAISLIDGTK